MLVSTLFVAMGTLLTRKRPLVQSQYRPPSSRRSTRYFVMLHTTACMALPAIVQRFSLRRAVRRARIRRSASCLLARNRATASVTEEVNPSGPSQQAPNPMRLRAKDRAAPPVREAPATLPVQCRDDLGHPRVIAQFRRQGRDDLGSSPERIRSALAAAAARACVPVRSTAIIVWGR